MNCLCTRLIAKNNTKALTIIPVPSSHIFEQNTTYPNYYLEMPPKQSHERTASDENVALKAENAELKEGASSITT